MNEQELPVRIKIPRMFLTGPIRNKQGVSAPVTDVVRNAAGEYQRSGSRLQTTVTLARYQLLLEFLGPEIVQRAAFDTLSFTTFIYKTLPALNIPGLSEYLNTLPSVKVVEKDKETLIVTTFPSELAEKILAHYERFPTLVTRVPKQA